MGGCSIRKCKSRCGNGGSIRFFRFPKDGSVAEEWLRYCRPKTSIQNGRVCSDHFISSDYAQPLRHILLKYSPKNARKLKPDAIPTQKLDDIDSVVTSINIDNEKSNALPVQQIVDKDNTSNNDTEIIIEITPTIEFIDSPEEVKKSTGNISIPLNEYKMLQRTANKFNVLKNNLDTIFTSGQIRCLMTSDKRRVKWSADDISAAISLKSISPKGYRYLRNTVGIPLPASSTLRKWTSKSGIEELYIENEPSPEDSSG